ncbi:hypothetical protein CDL15_Pgr020937 [Punica granatum]|uniref:Uncharacterized protein n=1 Tax=Punica granatum TaxID=22663 RepID=A0A218WRK6_PUNGR|nr:hypothetical protein CDL15_Pgr020937 [Punica granatum]
MAKGDHVDVSEEINPSVPALSQPPQAHAPPPLTPAGVLPAYSAALPTHLPPPASSGGPQPPVSPTSAATNDQARIAALEGTVNQMATNIGRATHPAQRTQPGFLEFHTSAGTRAND